MSCWFLLYNKENQLQLYICPLPLEPLFHPTPIPPRLSQSPTLSSCTLQQLPTSVLFHTCSVYMSVRHPTLSFPYCVCRLILYICVSVPALQISPSVPLFSRFNQQILTLYLLGARYSFRCGDTKQKRHTNKNVLLYSHVNEGRGGDSQVQMKCMNQNKTR